MFHLYYCFSCSTCIAGSHVTLVLLLLMSHLYCCFSCTTCIAASMFHLYCCFSCTTYIAVLLFHLFCWFSCYTCIAASHEPLVLLLYLILSSEQQLYLISPSVCCISSPQQLLYLISAPSNFICWGLGGRGLA